MDYQRAKQAVKDTVDIVDIISRYTSLVPAGKRMKGLSPFTNEKTPSFFVDPEEGVYYCFSSQKGGDIFTFVQEMEGVEFKEALHILAEQAGIELSAGSVTKQDDRSPLYQVLDTATALYQKNMKPEVMRYLKDRGVTEKSVQTWKIGYAPDAWNTLCEKNMPLLTENVLVGMCVQKDKNIYDRFRSRIMFPFHNPHNKIIGFSGREYGKQTEAKYINSPESVLFNKSNFLYGLHIAKPNIRRSNLSILTEGQLDTILVHQAGYPIAVATSGTAVTEDHLRQLQRLSNRLLLCFDGDNAGVQATIRVIGMACALGMDIKIVPLPQDTDPADCIANDVKAFKRAIKEAVPMIQFLLEYVSKHHGDKNEDILRGVREEVLPIIIRVRDPLTKEYAIGEIAKKCGVSKEALIESMRHISKKTTSPHPPRRVKRLVHKEKNRTQEYLEIAAHAKAFLVSKNISPPSQLQAVEKFKELPKIDERIARVRYEERFSDSAEQVKVAQEELLDMLKRLLPSFRKQEELNKLNKEDN